MPGDRVPAGAEDTREGVAASAPDVAELKLALDRSSPVPLYFQVALQIEEAIATGVVSPGARLENELRMADRHGLSRPTIRRAIQELVDKGLVVRRRGIGTRVVDNPQVKREVRLTSLYDDLVRSDKDPTTDVRGYELVGAEEHVAEQLNVDIGAEVVFIERLRYADGEPLAVMRNWLPTAVAGHLTAEQLRDHGLYELLRAGGIRLRMASQRMGARIASPEEARLLDILPGAPLLTMQRTTYDEGGRALELGDHVYRADTYSFEVMVVDR